MKYDIYDKQKLINLVHSGHNFKFLFFWGHQPNNNGIITKSCLSQWYKSSFIVKGIKYLTAEHYLMAEKARLFNDEKILNEILSSSSPNEAKLLGRKILGFDNKVWEAHRFHIALNGNIEKFTQSNDLKKFLLNLDDTIIVEASPKDNIWGIGLSADDLNSKNPEKWNGLNLLGFVLMKVRDIIT